MTRRARTLWAVDSETDPFKRNRVPGPFLWGAYNGDEYHEFRETDDFMAFITEQYAHVYAHNGGKFDWQFILKHMEPNSEFLDIQNRISKFQIKNAIFLDSINILPFALSKYKKDTFDYEKMEAGTREKHMPEISQYLKNDCVYLHELLTRHNEEFGHSITLASSALKWWRKNADQKTPSSSPMFFDEFSPYYFGGRVECFETGIIDEEFQCADISSAYAAAMIEEHPFGTQFDVSATLPQTEAHIKRCFITLTADSTGAFPYRELHVKDSGEIEAKGATNFPTDGLNRTFTITGHEYIAARKTDTLTNCEIKTVYQFADSINFKDYVMHFYARKNKAKFEGDAAGYLFSKHYMTNLYGKLGANPRKYFKNKVVEPHLISAAIQDGWDYAGPMGPWANMERPLDPEDMRFLNVATAASVTGCVRAFMWESLNKCSGVIYCDTDSIFARDVKNLHVGDNLGDWNIEATCSQGAFSGKKLYCVRRIEGSFHKSLKGKVDADGKTGEFKKASKGGDLTPAQLYKCARGEIVTYDQITPSFSPKRPPRFLPTRHFKKTAN